MTGCEHQDVLLPMMWLAETHPPLMEEFVRNIRPGLPVDYLPAPFSHWVLQTKEGIPNALRMLLHIYK